MDITSKISLYDLFAMIIPGGIIIAMILYFCNFCPYCDIIKMFWESEMGICNPPSFLLGAIFVICSYIVGLLNNTIADSIFTFFRNNVNFIYNEVRRVITENGNINLWKFVRTMFDNDNPVNYNLFSYFNTTIWMSNNTLNPRIYFSAYYALSQNKLLGNVPILEAQIVLIRNLLFPLFLLVVFLCWQRNVLFCWLIYGINKEWYGLNALLWSIVVPLFMIVILFIIAVLFIIMVERQNRVYRMVWEAANYYEL